jgi:hypothetical protein
VEKRGAPSVRGREPSGVAWAATSPLTQKVDKCAQWEGKRVPPLQERVASL